MVVSSQLGIVCSDYEVFKKLSEGSVIVLGHLQWINWNIISFAFVWLVRFACPFLTEYLLWFGSKRPYQFCYWPVVGMVDFCFISAHASVSLSYPAFRFALLLFCVLRNGFHCLICLCTCAQILAPSEYCLHSCGCNFPLSAEHLASSPMQWRVVGSALQGYRDLQGPMNTGSRFYRSPLWTCVLREIVRPAIGDSSLALTTAVCYAGYVQQKHQLLAINTTPHALLCNLCPTNWMPSSIVWSCEFRLNPL